MKFTWPIALLLLAACATPDGERSTVVDAAPARPAPVDLPWTEAFRGEAFLVADEIEVIGPVGIRDHVVLQQNTLAEYGVRTTERGLLQELVVKDGRAELRAQLDNWILVAARSLRVLEVPNEVPVRVRGVGQALFRTMDGEPPRRGAALEFFGARP